LPSKLFYNGTTIRVTENANLRQKITKSFSRISELDSDCEAFTNQKAWKLSFITITGLVTRKQDDVLFFQGE